MLVFNIIAQFTHKSAIKFLQVIFHINSLSTVITYVGNKLFNQFLVAIKLEISYPSPQYPQFDSPIQVCNLFVIIIVIYKDYAKPLGLSRPHWLGPSTPLNVLFDVWFVEVSLPVIFFGICRDLRFTGSKYSFTLWLNCNLYLLLV
jgi:hypothetical protein